MKDFFISYNQADRRWAEWIAWQLEDFGYSTVLQAWDFRPGSNFALEMHMAAQEAERTIAVLSPAYLQSPFTLSEWAAAFASDSASRQGKLIPVRVRNCDPTGILKQIVYIDLVDVSPDQAKNALLSGVERGRGKPRSAPAFPGAVLPPEEATQIFPERHAAPIRVLHLSDLHLGSERNEIFQRSAYVRLAESVRQDGQLDLLLVSGDLTFRGDRQGFAAAREFLLELLERLEIRPDHGCFVVPGNHDVYWPDIGPADRLILQNLKSEESIAQVLSHSQTMFLLGARLAGFYEFTQLMFGRIRGWRSERPWRVDKASLSGSKIGIIQLNSAWSLGPPSSTVPVLGEFQVRDALTEVVDCPIRIWLVHHPLSALHQHEQARINTLLANTDGADLVFCGSGHEARSITTQNNCYLEFSAGWKHMHEERPHVPVFGANIVEIHQDTATIKVATLRFEHSTGEWLRVPALGTTTQEAFTLSLPKAQKVEPCRPKVAKPVRRDSKDQEVVEAIRSRGPDALTSIKAVSEKQFRTELTSRPVLLLTATEVELRAVLSYMRPIKRKRAILRGHIGKETYYLGKYGAENVILTMCGAGAMGRDSVILATQEAVTRFSPKGIVMVGIAFGRSQVKQALGDVIVASQVISYEQQRVGGKQTIQRGIIVETGPTLLNRIRQALDWVFVGPEGRQARMLIGPILSGEKLVDKAAYKEDLFKSFPQAIGGEMEGAGLYAAAARSGVEWIIIKGICDWADGTKSDDAQPLAAASAASLVHHVFSDPAVLESL